MFSICRKISFSVFFLLISLVMFTPFLLLAADGPVSYQPLIGIPGLTDAEEISMELYINTLYTISISIAAFLAVVKIILAGLKYMLSDVVTNKEDAKRDIKGALVGLMIVLGAWIILSTINPQLVNLQALQNLDALEGIPGPTQDNPFLPQCYDVIVNGNVESVCRDNDVELRTFECLDWGCEPETDTCLDSGQVEDCESQLATQCRCSLATDDNCVTRNAEAYLRPRQTLATTDRLVCRLDRLQTALSEFVPSPDGKICYHNNVCLDAYTYDQVIGSDSVNYNYPSDYPVNFQNFRFIKINESRVQNAQISTRFRVRDLTRVDSRRGDYVYLDPVAVRGIDRVAERLGTTPQINSGYRSPGHNSNLRRPGARLSMHMSGLAFDIQPPGGRDDRCRVVRACRAEGAGFIMLYNDTTHVHCDWRSGTPSHPTIAQCN